MRWRRRRASPVVQALRSPVVRLVAGSVVVVGGVVAAGIARARDAKEAAREPKRGYRLETDETPKQGISRVARGELDLTIGLLEGGPNGDGGVDAVHEARKALKRLRALLRVSRPALEDARYRREDVVLRDAGRELSDARDAQVMVETLDSLLERFGDELPPGTGARLRDELAASAQRAQAHGTGNYEGVLDVLSRARERVSSWPLPQQNGRASLAEGFEKIYKKGRRARRHAASDPTAENLHELRKRAKDLWHASQLLESMCPGKFKRLAKDAHRLSDLLGDDHDLSVLLEYARQHPRLLRTGDLELLESVIGLRSQSLRRQALDHATELYRRRPARMVQRLALA
jgi:CHAD domain-containing protein